MTNAQGVDIKFQAYWPYSPAENIYLRTEP